MSSLPPNPITKVIFAPKIFRFAGRDPKDLVIINSVCKDFEETMQTHHTFNLVLYDNIIKKRKDEDGFLHQSFELLSEAPAWIVYQWTTVNENDETQRELLKTFLLYQAENGNKILIRRNVSGEVPSTTRELFLHILDSCVKLRIVKEVLEASRFACNCIMEAVSRQISADILALLIESCVRHGLDVKKMLEQTDDDGLNCITISASCRLPAESFKFLFETCAHHGVDLKMMLEENTSSGWNCITLASGEYLPVTSFKLLIEACARHRVDIKEMLEHQDSTGWNCLSLAVCCELPIDFLRLLIAHFPSNESFRATLSVKNDDQKSAVDYATTEEFKAFLEDPDCWKKCCEWRKEQEVL